MLNLHEVKDNPVEPEENDFRIVEAYGDRKYPKLVEQVASDLLEIRVKALAVLCDEFRNPFGIYGCCISGVIQIIAAMCTDPDFTTRKLASRAVNYVAGDSYGSGAILDEQVVPLILEAMRDTSAEVRGNVYETMCQLSRTKAGANACITAKVVQALTKVLPQENETLQPVLLKCIYNMSAVDLGLVDALDGNAVKMCIQFLSSTSPQLRTEAARTLGLLCFSDRGKDIAVEHSAVPELMSVLASTKMEDSAFMAAASLSLMAVSSTDEAKRQLNVVSNAIELVVQLLHSPDKVVTLNALKIIANVAVHPSLRNQLKRSEEGLASLQRLADGNDAFTKKHAKVAYDAVMWKP